MNSNNSRGYFISVIFIFLIYTGYTQPIVIDQVVGVVGSNMILLSDVENQFNQMKAAGTDVDETSRCKVFEELLVQKLLINQSKIDSVEVSAASVEIQLEARLKYFVNQIGSKEKLEAYFNKPYLEIKEDLRSKVRDQLITQKMEAEITGDTKITPTEVEDYYKSLSKDSVPYVGSQIEYCQINKYPKYTDDAIYEVKEKLLDLRKRIIDGERFSTLAKLYSEDPGSARNGGEIGFMSKGELDPEYAKIAFTLKEGQVSKIVESQFGYHIIQLIERKEDKINTRHILIKPKASITAFTEANRFMDSIAGLIRNDSLKFNKAALYFSDDKNSKLSGGLVLNPQTNSSKFEMDQISPTDYYALKNLNVGQVSDAFQSLDESGKQVVKTVMLKSRTTPHRANLTDDYQIIQEMATNHKKEVMLKNWIVNKQKTTFITIKDPFSTCVFENNGWIKHDK